MYYEERCHLIKKLKSNGYIKTEKVENAFLDVPREYFVSRNLEKCAYFDTPLEIGKGQTISAPHMVALMCEALDINEGQDILEIGSGSGYHAAIVSKIVGEKGHVYSIERISSLAEKSFNNLKRAGIKNVTIQVGDGSMGLKKYGPYNRIYITCAAPNVLDHLMEQLKNNGKLLVPIGRRICDLMLYKKKGTKIIKENLGRCAFVPLVGKYGF